MCVIFTYLGYAAVRLRNNNVNEIDDLRKRLLQTWFYFEHDVIDAAID